jgi:purine-binding chemotaxis protein CheW
LNLPGRSPASEQLLEEVKLYQRRKDVVDVDEGRVKVVLFRAGAGIYAFPGETIREILSGHEIAWVPNLPAFLPGLIHVRGDIESVIDIRCFLGGEGAKPGSGLVLLAVKGDFRSGILVDAVEDVADVPLSALKPPLSTLGGAARDLVSAEIDLGGTVIPLLELDKLAAKVTL